MGRCRQVECALYRSIDVCDKLGAICGNVDEMTFKAANVVVKRDPRAVISRGAVSNSVFHP